MFNAHTKSVRLRVLTEKEKRAICAEHGGEATNRSLMARFSLSEIRLREVWQEAGLGPRPREPSSLLGLRDKRRREARARKATQG